MPQALGSFVDHQLSAKSPGIFSRIQDVQRVRLALALGCQVDAAVALPNVTS